jgi:hypothetical protein
MKNKNQVKHKEIDPITSTIMCPNTSLHEAIDMMVGQIILLTKQVTQWETYADNADGMSIGLLLATGNDNDGRDIAFIRDTRSHNMVVYINKKSTIEMFSELTEPHIVGIVCSNGESSIFSGYPLHGIFKDNTEKQFMVCLSEEELMESIERLTRPFLAEALEKEIKKYDLTH